MNDDVNMVADAARRIFHAHLPSSDRAATREEDWVNELWLQLEMAGLTHPAAATDFGGSGGSAQDERTIAELSGYYATGAPVTETMLAGHALASAGLNIPTGGLTVVLSDTSLTIHVAPEPKGTSLDGKAIRVPWSSLVESVVVIAPTDAGGCHVLCVPMSAVHVSPGENVAGEARVALRFEHVKLAPEKHSASSLTFDNLRARAALLRATQIGGAAARALELSVEHANSRMQFGRKIGAFQAIQHQLAVLAEETAAVQSAAAAAYDHLDDNSAFPFYAAVAKLRAADAARIASATAHQVHGAIGFCYEHPLHFATRRLLAWRSEFGSEHMWAVFVGRVAHAAGADGIWPLLVK